MGEGRSGLSVGVVGGVRRDGVREYGDWSAVMEEKVGGMGTGMVGVCGVYGLGVGEGLSAECRAGGG